MLHRTLRYVFPSFIIVLTVCLSFITLFPFHQNSQAASQSHPVIATPALTGSTPSVNWPTYLFGNDHQGYNPYETTISSANVASLVNKWKFQATGPLVAEPIIENGTLYEGSWDGYMYALSATKGTLQWKTNLGTYISSQCTARGGPSGAAAYSNGMIYVGSGPNFYALDASSGAIIWQQRLGTSGDNSDHIWDSATVANGNVYVGVASLCDHPLTQGILYALNAMNGTIVAQADIVPNGKIGGGIWDAPTIDPATHTVIVTTGSIDKRDVSPMEAAVVTLDWDTLAVKQFWQVPATQRQYDADFGASATLFPGPNGATYFGCINKNTIYYVFDEANVSAGPVWQEQLGPGGDRGGSQGSITTSAYLNGTLYIATSIATVNGNTYPGSIGAFDALSGQPIWRVGTAGAFYAAPILADGLVYDAQGNTLEARDQSTGNVLYSRTVNSQIEASPTVANGIVYFAAFNKTLYALKPGA